MYGCFGISCQKCKYLRQVNKDLYTCERERLLKILWPEYKDEVLRIEEETEDIVNAIFERESKLGYYKKKYNF
jgi:hypothetical protein